MNHNIRILGPTPSRPLHANVNVLNAYGSTPLQDCVSGDNGTAEIASLLLDKGADSTIPNRSGQTPLQRALAKNRDDLVQVLKDHGAKQ